MSTLTRSESRGSLSAQAPVVAAVDNSASSQAAIDAGVALARELNAPLLFAYVRRGPASFLGEPVYQRRLTKKMKEARRALSHALRAAEVAGVEAEGTILEGSPWRRIVELARDRAARNEGSPVRVRACSLRKPKLLQISTSHVGRVLTPGDPGGRGLTRGADH